MNLRRLSNNEFELAEKEAKRSGVPLDACPTCGSAPVLVRDDTHGFETGKYSFDGDEYACDCPTQMALRRHYLVAGIGDQYMRLHWERFEGNSDVKEKVNTYLEKWESFKRNGIGVELSSVGLGTGKTFCATHIGKELVKRGESAYFVPFRKLVSALSGNDEPEYVAIARRLREVTVLIIDDIVAPMYQQGPLFADKLEELIRERTDYNLPNIITTNLTGAEMLEYYDRSYSLLSAKEVRINLVGSDYRADVLSQLNIELALNNEVHPIT